MKLLATARTMVDNADLEPATLAYYDRLAYARDDGMDITEAFAETLAVLPTVDAEYRPLADATALVFALALVGTAS